jgi:hypothetical protein
MSWPSVCSSWHTSHGNLLPQHGNLSHLQRKQWSCGRRHTHTQAALHHSISTPLAVELLTAWLAICSFTRAAYILVLPCPKRRIYSSLTSVMSTAHSKSAQTSQHPLPSGPALTCGSVHSGGRCQAAAGADPQSGLRLAADAPSIPPHLVSR